MSKRFDGGVSTPSERFSVISDGLPSQLPDVDPSETAEWLDSLDAVVDRAGRGRARFLMLKLLERAREKQVGVPALRSTDYINTISPEREPWFPGDEHVERRIRAYVRWNAAMLVSRANRPEIGVGGHIATYASAASLYEVGFNHFFQGRDGGNDQVYFQGHASPGIYARAFLEGRLTQEQLDGFRQESLPASLPSYPHPRLMPDFWEFPTVSMGLGPLAAIYQARFNRYLLHRGIKDTSSSHVWCFLGDGEMDEPESLGAIGVAAREELDMRAKVSAGRKGLRRGIQVVVGTTVGFGVFLSLFGGTYVQPYDTFGGQVALAVVLGIFALGFAWMRRLAGSTPVMPFLARPGQRDTPEDLAIVAGLTGLSPVAVASLSAEPQSAARGLGARR